MTSVYWSAVCKSCRCVFPVSTDRGEEAYADGFSSLPLSASHSIGDKSTDLAVSRRKRKCLVTLNVDIISDEFWGEHPKILS